MRNHLLAFTFTVCMYTGRYMPSKTSCNCFHSWGSKVVFLPEGQSTILQELHKLRTSQNDKDEGTSLDVCVVASNGQWDWAVSATVSPLSTAISSATSESHHFIHGSGRRNLGSVSTWTITVGPFQGKTILVIIDSHSKWIGVYPTDSSTSSKSHWSLSQVVCSVWYTRGSHCHYYNRFEHVWNY